MELRDSAPAEEATDSDADVTPQGDDSTDREPSGKGRSRSAHSGGREAGQTEESDDDSSSDDTDGDKSADKKPAKKPKPRARKVKHRGEEVEFDPDDDESVEQFVQRLSKPYKLKIDGEEQEASYEDLISDAERRTASNKRFEAAAKKEREEQRWLAQIKANPIMAKQYLQKRLGIDPYQALYADLMEQQRVEKLLQPDPTKTPEENAQRAQEYHRLKWEMAREEAQRELEMQQQQQREQERQVEIRRRAAEFEQKLPVAFKARGLELDDVTWPVLMRIQQRFSQTGQEATPESLAYETMRTLQGYATRQIPKEPEKLVEMLGEERLKALRKHLAQLEKKKLEDKARGGGGSSSESNSTPSPKKKGGTGTLSDLPW